MRHTQKLLSLTAVVLLAACTDNSITNPINDAAGTYQLTVYAGKTIPANYIIQAGDPSYTQYPNGATFVVTGGNLVLSNNGTFIETNNYVTTPTGQAAQNSQFVSSGTWTISGTQVFLTAPAQNGNSARNIQGTLTIDTINYQEDNGAGGFDQFEYKR
jgi:hypothetical protein